MSRPPRLDALSIARRNQLIEALRECGHRLKAGAGVDSGAALERAYVRVDGHPQRFGDWVDGYCEGLQEQTPELIGDELKRVERIRDGLLHPQYAHE